MTSGIYVLIMVWSTSASSGGVTTLAQEFSSKETCEVARAELVKTHDSERAIVRAHGCFKK